MADENIDAPRTGRGSRIGTALEGQRGQAPHIRSEELASDIVKLSRIGLTNQMIIDYLSTFDGMKISMGTLKNHYQGELSLGRSGGVVLAANKLMEKIREGNLTAIIFYLKTKGGFIETRGVQVRDKDNLPTDFQLDLSKANKEDIDVLKRYFGQFLGDDAPIGNPKNMGRSGKAGRSA